jgi:ABC-type antimicrobial peptide transport system permease subunit
MKPSRCLRAKSLLIVSILALATFGTTLAWAKPKPFVPSPGSYSGTSTTLGQSFDTKGGVYIHKGNVSLVVSIRVLLNCTVEGTVTTVTLDQAFVVKPKGKTFGIKASGSNGSSAYYHYDLGGKFTSKSAFSGTLTVKGNAGSCSGVSQFSLKKG